MHQIGVLAIDQTTEDVVSLRLAGGPEAAAVARRAIARMRGDLDAPLLETLRLLVTELVTNSVRHAKADQVDLELRVTEPAVRVEVHDRGPGFSPRQRVKDQDPESGWGLFLVERLANRWGVVNEGLGTRVWLELDRS